MKIIKTVIFSLSAIGMLAGCGSSGSSGGANGSAVSFALPSGVDVLKVDSNASSDYDDSGTDYSNAKQSFHVSHPVGEALSSTSNIMCFIGQLGIAKMWNDSALPRVYLASVDQSVCESSSGQPSQGAAAGGSSGAATELTMVTVRLSREAPGLFPRAEIWFTEADNGQEREIRASIDVLQEPSASLPYGRFNLFFRQFAGGSPQGGGNLLVTGTAAAPIAFTFYEAFTEMGQTQTRSASVEMAADGSNLKAGVQEISPWNGNSAWVVASNGAKIRANNKKANNTSAGSVAEVDLNGGACLKTDDFKYRIYGYGLYEETTGHKVELQTGVQCQYTDSSSKVRNCNISSNGAWFEPETGGAEHHFANGDHVTRRAWGDNASHDGEDLTLFVADGRLRRYIVKKYNLTDIRGFELRMFDNTDGHDYIVKYFNASDAAVPGYSSPGFYKVGQMQWNMGGPPSKVDITPAVNVTPANDVYAWFYADSLGGVSFVGGKTFVTARIEQAVNPNDAAFSGGSIALKCLNRCPKSAITQGNLTTWNGPFVADPANVGAAVDYTFVQTDMSLRKGTLASDPAVALAGGVSFTDNSSMYQFGLETGAMVDGAHVPANLWAIYDTEGNEYYQYRMGPNNWDKLVIAKHLGTPLTFDDPIAFDYTHTTANDRNDDATFNGKKFLLRYQGEGHIDGFPWDQVDRDGDGNPDMWFPKVSLKDNVQLTDGVDNYRIKGLYGDLTLEPALDCTGLNLQRPVTALPASVSGVPSNAATAKPDHGSCQYDSETESASTGC